MFLLENKRFLVYNGHENVKENDMHYTYRTKNTCSSKIDFDIENGIIKNVVFTGGCNGNLKAISKLIEGWKAEDVVRVLEGNTCGFRSTSCADQLAKAIKEVSSKN